MALELGSSTECLESDPLQMPWDPPYKAGYWKVCTHLLSLLDIKTLERPRQEGEKEPLRNHGGG